MFQTNPRTVSNCHSEVNKGNTYHEIYYIPSTDMTRVFRDDLKYVHKNNEYSEGSLLNRGITTSTHFIKKQIFTISIVPTHLPLKMTTAQVVETLVTVKRGLRYCGIGLFFTRYFGNFLFNVRYCGIISLCGFSSFWLTVFGEMRLCTVLRYRIFALSFRYNTQNKTQ